MDASATYSNFNIAMSTGTRSYSGGSNASNTEYTCPLGTMVIVIVSVLSNPDGTITVKNNNQSSLDISASEGSTGSGIIILKGGDSLVTQYVVTATSAATANWTLIVVN